MRTIWSTLWLRTGPVNVQMANEANLCAEVSWAVRARNGSSSGWCGSAFFKFPSQLSYCIPSCFTDFHSMFNNFTPLVFVLHQIFQALRGDTERFHGDPPCVFEALFLASLGIFALKQFVIGKFLWEAVIFHMDNMNRPMKLWLHQDRVDGGKRSLS